MLLGAADLAAMQAVPPEVCPRCLAETTRNYCREHDEFFQDGHAEGCAEATHLGHRSYRNFAATSESDLVKLYGEYQREGRFKGLKEGL